MFKESQVEKSEQTTWANKVTDLNLTLPKGFTEKHVHSELVEDTIVVVGKRRTRNRSGSRHSVSCFQYVESDPSLEGKKATQIVQNGKLNVKIQ